MVPIGRVRKYETDRLIDPHGAFVIEPPLRLFIELSLVIENHHTPF